MHFGRQNIIAGCVALFVAAAGGMALGFTMDAYFARRFYEMPLTRALMKAGHTHGMPFALYNLIYGSLLAMLSFIMPFGLVMRGVDNAAMTFAPIVMLGALCFLASVAVLVKGAVARKKE